MNFELLTDTELDGVLSLLPRPVLRQLQTENVVLAGGAIRDVVAGIPVKDLDVFCHSETQTERLAIEVSPFVRRTLFACSVDLGIPVQYVFYKDFADLSDLIGQFDFRACGAGIVWDQLTARWIGIALEGFHADCEAKRLVFLSQPKDAGKLTALDRALRLAKKGWTLSTEETAKIIQCFEPGIEPSRLHDAFRPGYGGVR